MISQDEYETVINSQATYDGIVEFLKVENHRQIIFAWTDQEGTQLDILMSYRPMQFGHLQRGMKSRTDLFVAVSSFGMFGFELNGAWKSPGYVGSKLGLGDENTTTKALAVLINGVCERLK